MFLLLLHWLTLIISPLPKNWQNCCLVSLKMFLKSTQNWLLSSPEDFHEIGHFSAIVFWRNFTWIFLQDSCEICCFSVNLSLKISRNLTFFCDLSEALCYETVLDLVAFFLSPTPPPPPTFFPPASWTSIMFNLDQSYLKKVKVWSTLEAWKNRQNVRSFKDLTGQSLFLTRNCPLTGRYLKPCLMAFFIIVISIT